MGVYNPFAELPNSCVLCDSREKCDLHREYAGRSVGRHPDCPLVEVKTPHGRLIDADALLLLCKDYAITQGDDEFCKRLEYALTKAPTIIEAEG